MATADYLKTRAASTNRYRLTKVYIDDFVVPGRRRYGLWRVPEIDMTDFARYVVKASDLNRIDLVAYRFYKDVTLWWAICIVNNISNPFEDLEIGMMLKIPRIENIAAAFSGAKVE